MENRHDEFLYVLHCTDATGRLRLACQSLLRAVKTFIRNVRATKTIADERAVVQKESAAIRASFREESHDPNTRYGRL